MNVYQFNCHLSKLVQIPVQIPVQTLLELEANLLDQIVNELEFELKTVQVNLQNLLEQSLSRM